MEDKDLEQRIEQARRKLYINETGLICHATYFKDIPYILQNGLTVENTEKETFILPKGINITLMGYLIERSDTHTPSIARFNLEEGEGVVFLGDPANTHVPKQYRQFSSDERPIFALFKIPSNTNITFNCQGLQCEMTDSEIKERKYQERNENMTGMIISSPDIPRNWLRCFVIPPYCYVHPNKFTRNKVKERTLDYIDIKDSRIKIINNKFDKAFLIPQEILVEKVIEIMNQGIKDKSKNIGLYDVCGNCLYTP